MWVPSLAPTTIMQVLAGHVELLKRVKEFATSVTEGRVKSKENLDSLEDRFDQDFTCTVSPREGKFSVYNQKVDKGDEGARPT
jgi:hypothetical protein